VLFPPEIAFPVSSLCTSFFSPGAPNQGAQPTSTLGIGKEPSSAIRAGPFSKYHGEYS
jgi:hypothetical protein